MTIHEFGNENKRIIILVHPSVVMWDYFSYVIPLMEKNYHLVIPALPGYDKDNPGDFTSVEQIAAELADWLIEKSYQEVECVYGCSMGGSIVAKMLSDRRVVIKNAVIDGGITPYQLPWLITRLIAIKDFLMVSLGKFGGVRLLEKMFSTDEYSKEDLQYIAGVMKMISYRTIWRTFESCNNYRMPERVISDCDKIEYWLAESEVRQRRKDIRYFRKNFPQTKFRRIHDVGHGGLASLHPEKLVKGIENLCGGKGV